MFNLEAPGPILLEAEVVTTPEDFAKAGLKPMALPVDKLHVALELRWMGTYTTYTIQRFETADGKDFATASRSPTENVDLTAVSMLLSKSPRIAAEPAERFTRVGIDRARSPEIALALYDAKESPDIRRTCFIKRRARESRCDCSGPACNNLQCCSARFS